MPNPFDFHTPQSSYSKEDLLKSSEGGYFGPGNAQLPAPPMAGRSDVVQKVLEVAGIWPYIR